MNTLKTIFRRAKTLLWTAFSILVVLAAVLVGVGKLLMPYSDRYQPRLEAWLTEEFGQPVVIDSFEGEWTAFGPRLSLQGLKLLPEGVKSEDAALQAEADVVIESAALDIRPMNLLIPGLPHYNFRVIGADFELLHAADGQFRLSGFGVSNRGSGGRSSALRELARVGEVVLEDSSLIYIDERHGIELGFSAISGSLNLEGEELSTEVEAQFFDSRSGLVYGEVEAVLRLTLDDDQKVVEADWYALTSEIMLAAFQGRVPANPFLPLTGWLGAELWGQWSRQDGHRVSGETGLRKAWLVNEYQDMMLEHIDFQFRWQHSGPGFWNLHLADLLFDDGEKSWTAPRVSIARNTGEDLGLWISADELPLDVPLNLARDVMSLYDTPWPPFLPQAASGKVSDLQLGLSSKWRLKFATGEVMQASVTEWDRWPDLQGLNAVVALRGQAGRIHLDGENLLVDWPNMFRAPVAVSLPGCDLDLRWGEGWQVGFSDCSLENADLAAEAEILISGNENKPAVDVNVALSRGKVGALDPYWPESIMRENIKSWLRRGLQGGDIVSGRLQIFGDMDDWPFRSGEGRFEAVAEVANVEIDFLEEWPAARQVNAIARFVGAGMDIRGSVGDIAGSTAQEVSATIADMKAPLLKINYESSGDLPGYLGFLRQTPLQDLVQVDLTQFTFAGPGATEGSISVPLGDTEGELRVNGRYIAKGNLFSDPVSEVVLDNISGDIRYSETGLSGPGLGAEYRGHPAELSLTADQQSREKFRADLQGRFGIRDVIPEFLLEDFLALNQVGGDADWIVSLVVAPGQTSSDGPAEIETVLHIRSELEGVAMNLPLPMSKSPAERWPLTLRLPISGQQRLLDVVFEDRAALRFDLAEETGSPKSAVIRLGTGLPVMPPEGFIRLEGESEFVNLDGWIDVIIEEAMRGTGVSGLALEGGSLTARRLLFLDRVFEDVDMRFDVQGSDVSAQFDARDINGKLRYTIGDTGAGNLSAEFERLVLGDPVSTGLEMESDPSDLPALHLYARSFSYAGVELGETRIEAYPTATGFHFEKVDASSDRLSVQASGDWSLDEQGQRSAFDIHMASESLGDFLQSMDISSPMQGGQTLVDFKAWWPGSPAAFGLSRLNGQIEFSVVDGNITDASAGTGRLLGLLSIQALPKRLSLDFRDVFDSGFSFDEATGTFNMQNGTATTDDVLLKSSAADIMVSGSTNLVDQRYDQLLTIRPGLGNTLPIIGALAAGPGGAAAGLALQGLLQDELAEATQVQYTITGDWENPEFKAVDVDVKQVDES